MTILGVDGDMSVVSVHSRSGFIQLGRRGNMVFLFCLFSIWVRGSTDSIIILNGSGGRKDNADRATR